MAIKTRKRPGVKGVATAERVLQVLSAFKRGDGPLPLVDLADRTGLVKTTIMRLAVSLERRGYLNRLADGTYQLAGELMRLNSVYQDSLNLEQHVLPVLHELVQQTGETAVLFIRQGAYRLCLYRVDSPHLLRMHLQPGDMRPMDQASSAQILRSFEKLPPGAPLPFTLPVYSAGATEPHAASASVPVIGRNPAVLGALGISGPTSRLTAERTKELTKPLLAAGAKLTRALGGEYPYDQFPSR